VTDEAVFEFPTGTHGQRHTVRLMLRMSFGLRSSIITRRISSGRDILAPPLDDEIAGARPG
jgi:hypothetical protein